MKNKTLLGNKAMLIIHADTVGRYDDDFDGYGDEVMPDIKIEEIETDERLVEVLAQNIDWGAILPKLLKNDYFVQTLASNEFYNKSKINMVCDKAKPTGKFFYFNEGRNWTPVQTVDLEGLPGYQAEEMASNKSHLLMGINKSSLKDISPKAYKTMMAKKRELKKVEETKKANKKVLEEKKKQREIAKAKKLLEENGVDK